MPPVGLAFVVSLAVGLAATLACERAAARLGLVVAPRADRWHRRPVALLGGVAIMLGVLPALAWTGGLRGRLAELTLVALAMGAVGLVDDVRPLSPPVKLVAQIALAGLLVERDFVLRLTGVAVLDVMLTLVWVVGVTNAFNLLDNMDGLAAGMAVIAGELPAGALPPRRGPGRGDDDRRVRRGGVRGSSCGTPRPPGSSWATREASSSASS